MSCYFVNVIIELNRNRIEIAFSFCISNYTKFQVLLQGVLGFYKIL